MNNKDEVILKCTRVFKTKNDGSEAIFFKNEINGTTLECLLALVSMLVDFMEYLNKIRSGQV